MPDATELASELLIREATALDADALAQVYVHSWRHAYRGIIDQAYLDAMSIERRSSGYAAWFRNPAPSTFVRVAVDPRARVLGFAMGGPARQQGGPARKIAGEVYVIYLLPEACRRGLGTRLMRSMARGLDLRGMAALEVWALATNPARNFYARLGGRAGASRHTSVGRQRLEEVAYLWDDLGALGVA